nr:unnamed protein product [Callosobruchus analis]CAI5857849.1 unnamed protein product [Callosobruchus analis]
MEHRRNNKLIISNGHLRRLVNREVLRHRLRSEAASNSCTVHIESEGNYPPTQIEPEAMPVDLEHLSPNHKPSISETCTDNSNSVSNSCSQEELSVTKRQGI